MSDFRATTKKGKALRSALRIEFGYNFQKVFLTCELSGKRIALAVHKIPDGICP